MQADTLYRLPHQHADGSPLWLMMAGSAQNFEMKEELAGWWGAALAHCCSFLVPAWLLLVTAGWHRVMYRKVGLAGWLAADVVQGSQQQPMRQPWLPMGKPWWPDMASMWATSYKPNLTIYYWLLN